MNIRFPRFWKFVIVFNYFLFLGVTLYARGGGGQSGGVGGFGHRRVIGYLIALILAVLIGVALGVMLSRKKKASRKVILESSTFDMFWDVDAMEKYAYQTFLLIQDAWEKRNMDLVKDIVTERLYIDLKEKLNLMKRKREVNVLESVSVRSVDIIGANDFLDDKKDSYVVNIDGNMVDYIVDERSGKLLYDTKRTSQAFADIYRFVRYDNSWLLDSVENSVTIWNVVTTKNFREIKPDAKD